MRHPALPFLFAVSCVVNLGLGAWWVTRGITLKGVSDEVEAGRAVVAKELKPSARADPGAGAAEMEAGVHPLAAAMKRRDMRAVCDLLRESQLPDTLIFTIARTLNREWSEAVFDERYPAYALKKSGAWWTNEDGGYYAMELNAEAAKANWDIMLGGITRLNEIFPYRQRNDEWSTATDLTFLEPDRRADLRSMRFDFLSMRLETQTEAGAFRLPADAEAVRLIENEYLSERDAFLTPEERLRYELETTSGGSALRAELGKVNGTLDEMQRLMPLISDYERRFGNNAWYAQPTAEEKAAYDAAKSAAQKALDEAKRAVLGEERYRLAKLPPDEDRVVLEAAAKRFALPRETVETVYGSAAQVAAESQRLASDPAMDEAARRTALAVLARETRREVTALLGDEVAGVYLDKQMGWLKEVEGGAVLELDEDGRARVRKQAGPPTETDGGKP